jgi:hypothetical protein
VQWKANTFEPRVEEAKAEWEEDQRKNYVNGQRTEAVMRK